MRGVSATMLRRFSDLYSPNETKREETDQKYTRIVIILNYRFVTCRNLMKLIIDMKPDLININRYRYRYT